MFRYGIFCLCCIVRLVLRILRGRLLVYIHARRNLKYILDMSFFFWSSSLSSSERKITNAHSEPESKDRATYNKFRKVVRQSGFVLMLKMVPIILA